MNITQDDVMAIQAKGWSLVRTSPLTIQHRNGSQATGTAALYAIKGILAEVAAANDNPRQCALANLERLNTLISKAVEAATALNGQRHRDAWRWVYDKIFGPLGYAEAVKQSLAILGYTLRWFNPDTTYEATVDSYHKTLSRLLGQIRIMEKAMTSCQQDA